MHNKKAYSNLALVFSLLFAILFQSIHSIEHLVEQFNTEQCHHVLVDGKSQITHDHHNFDHCPLCDFTFSSFVAAPEYHIPAPISQYALNEIFLPDFIGKSSSVPEIFLRGPPSVIV